MRTNMMRKHFCLLACFVISCFIFPGNISASSGPAVSLPTWDAPAVAGGLPRFAVISDIHVGERDWEDQIKRAVGNIMSQRPLVDALFICGDLTDWGTKEQWQGLERVIFEGDLIPEGVRTVVMMGNHDHYTEGAEDLYRKYTGQELNQYIDIKGYPFITMSLRGKNQNNHTDEERNHLRSCLRDAALNYPGKPVFVFAHVGVLDTVYGTESDNRSYPWGTASYAGELEGYPQVILFSGHSHYSLRDPRSIHQRDFTSVNDGGTTYGEISEGFDDEGYKLADRYEVTEGVIVNVVPGGDVEIERWDTYRGEPMEPAVWTIRAPHDGSMFRFTDAARDTGIAPSFPGETKPVVGNITPNSCEVSFAAASDDENVFHYVVEIVDKATDSIAATVNKFSGFYLGSAAPSAFSVPVSGLEPGKEYYAQVTAYDSFMNASRSIISPSFRTPEP